MTDIKQQKMKTSIDIGISDIMRVVEYYNQHCLEEDIDTALLDIPGVSPQLRNEIVLQAAHALQKDERRDEAYWDVLNNTIHSRTKKLSRE